jgi:hypothetical protein
LNVIIITIIIIIIIAASHCQVASQHCDDCLGVVTFFAAYQAAERYILMFILVQMDPSYTVVLII